MERLSRRLKLALVPATVIAAAAIGAPAANAGILVKTAQSCASEQMSQPFAKWLDKNK